MKTTPSSAMFLFLLCLLMSCLPMTSLAADKVVVIPLFGHGKPLKNIITVAKAGGKFTDPVAAVNSITDASENNPYLVVIAPGVYTLTQTLVMKPWVDICGSGENVTKLTGAISHGESSAIIQSVAHTMLTNIAVKNTGGGEYCNGIYIRQSGVTVKLSHVTVQVSGGTNNRGIFSTFHSFPVLEHIVATAQGGTRSIAIYNSEVSSPQINQARATAVNGSFNYGVYNYHSSSPYMSEVYAYARGGNYAYGVRNDSSTPKLMQVTAKASAATHNYGIYNFDSSAMMMQVTAEGRAASQGGTHAYGIYNYASSPIISQVSATASGGNDCYGIYNYNNSSPIIRRSTFSGCVRGIYFDDGTSMISQSTVKGGVWSGGGTIKCVACDDGYGNALKNSCQ